MTRRHVFASYDEALELLHSVRAAVGDAALEEGIARIVADVEMSCSERTTFDRGRIVDALLDIRLVVSR